MKTDIQVGDLVKATRDYHNVLWYPKEGTIGVVQKLLGETAKHPFEKALVEWPSGSTTFFDESDTWYCPISWLEKVDVCCTNSQE